MTEDFAEVMARMDDPDFSLLYAAATTYGDKSLAEIDNMLDDAAKIARGGNVNKRDIVLAMRARFVRQHNDA